MKYELIMWLNHFLKLIPGNVGCWIRNVILPYSSGKNVKIYDGVHIDKPSKLILGKNISINRGTIINACGGVEIGDDVLIGPDVIIYSQNHSYGDSSRTIAEQGYVFKKTIIGSNVWLGARAIVLPGVDIGNNVVVGAGSVVTKSVADNSLVVGNPAKVVKKLYD